MSHLLDSLAPQMEASFSARDGDADSLFESQLGLASRSQLRELGVSDSFIRWALKRGKWESVHRGVYRLRGAPITWHQMLRAALLAAGPRAWISHRSAAALHGLTGYVAGPIELTTMHNKRRIEGATLHKTHRQPPFFPITIDGIVTAEASLTLLDLAAIDSIERVEEAMEDAIARRLTSVRKLEWFLTRASGSGKQGSFVLKKLLDYRLPGEEVPQSVMESRMDRMIRRGKLPRPIRQFSLRNESGREVARPDFAYPGRKLGIECQSYRWHFGRRKWHHDLERSNELTRLGWRILYFTWDQIENDPDAVIERIRGELGYLTLS